jgi:hypothetical protein
VSRGGARHERTRLGALEELLAGVADALEAHDPRSGNSRANELVATASGWIEEIEHDPQADPDLVGALRVLLNAGFGIRRLSGAKGTWNHELAGTCATLLAQGNDLLQVYASKRTDQP